ncbi:MAG TPA: hypothetical protein VLT83_05325 [Opitutaceae bacterium]|nr:hypothetical protein [Opitutaceae bacterium]
MQLAYNANAMRPAGAAAVVAPAEAIAPIRAVRFRLSDLPGTKYRVGYADSRLVLHLDLL